jgi:gliding motility-associated-like protein
LGLLKTIGRTLGLVLLCANGFGQSYLQFVENKGQWDSNIRFKGDMTTGAFALQKTGYRLLLHNKKDLEEVTRYMHNPAKVEDPNPRQTTAKKNENLPANSDGAGYDGVPGVLRSHVYEMRFLNGNPNPGIVPDKPLPSYNNYFLGNDSSKWAGNCRIYQAITYQNVYKGIDVRYYTSNGVLKYDFIVHPGANPNSIAMYYEGVESLKIVKGELHIKTSVDEVVENAPYTYQIVGGKRIEVPCRFDLKGNILQFKLEGNYSPDATLVIDPTMVFSTFTGSVSDNWGYTATYDGKGNFYSGGIVFTDNSGNAGFPVSNGAFQTNYGGGNGGTCERTGFDMGIMKFDPTGVNRVYATYIGGSGNDQPHSLVVDAGGNLIVAGRTSSSNYPSKGAIGNYGPLGGLLDIALTKLNASGSGIIASMRIGGSGDDGVNIRPKYCAPVGPESIVRNYGDDSRSEVIVDKAGNILLASCTQSANFPTTTVSPQTTLAGANAKGRAQDAVVMKFSPDLNSVIFSILVGGKDDDAAFVLAINPSDDHIFVGGSTASADFPGPKTGAKYGSFQGGASDGFVMELASNGVLLKDSYFGTSGIDMIYGIQFDKTGFPYIAGITTGTWPVVNANFSQAGGKQFISKLKPDLSDFVYSTVFGSGSAVPNLSIIAFLVDRCENVYVSGWGGVANTVMEYPTGFTNGLSVTPDAYQKRTDGSDFYFFVLEKNANSQLYGSFFGQYGGYGEHVDGGTSRFDANGVIYQAMCANCSSPKPTGADRFPTTPGVWSESNAAGDCNLAAVKIAFNLAGVGSGVRASINGVVRDTSGCVPMNAVFTDTLAQGKRYEWYFDDGSPSQVTTAPTVAHTFNTIGFYRVRLISIDSSTCNIADTSFVTMRVRDDQANLDFISTKLPPCTSLTYEFNNVSTAIKPFTNASFRWDFGDGTTQLAGSGKVIHAYAGPGTYNVKLTLIDTNYCNEPDSVIKQIRISPTVKAQFSIPPYGCAPFTEVFENTSMGGMSFIWDFGDGTTSTTTDPTHLYNVPGTYKVRLIASDPNSCNLTDTSAYFNIVVSSSPKSAFDYSPKPTEANTPVIFSNAAVGGYSFKWLFGDGDTLFTVQPDTMVRHLYNASGNYNACLVTYNQYGCIDTTCQVIPVVIYNSVNIPNAFSPNGDGRNDKIYVRGYGITKMSWSIYNRWGTLVYFGSDPNEGWDGRYKGVLQPQDVYHYTLVIEFSGEEKTTKKGDITLLR